MNILNVFKTVSIEQVTGIQTNITQEMYNAINLWSDMASGNAPWNGKAHSCGILDQITGKLHTMVSREIGLTVANPAIAEPMNHLNKNVDKIVDYITLLGGCILRPIYSNGKLQYELIPLGNYLPIRYDFDGTLTGALILKQIINGGHKFLLTEEHIYNGGLHSVSCKLYNNDSEAMREVPLTACPQTENLTTQYVWQGVKQPMIVEFRNHAVNKIDGSNVPVALVGGVGVPELIQDADEQYERMIWEQKAGEYKVFADRDLFTERKLKDGSIVGTQLNRDMKRLIIQVDGDGTAEGNKIKDFAPALRTESQNAMLQQILRRIELTTCMGKGTVSDLESAVQTATQYNGGRQSLFAIIDQIEDEIESKYHKCAEVFAHMAAAYKLGSNNSDITITWSDDTTRKDTTAAKQMKLQEISAGVLNKYEYRMSEYHEEEETAKKNVPQVASQDLSGLFGAGQ